MVTFQRQFFSLNERECIIQIKYWDLLSTPTEGTVWTVWKGSDNIFYCMPADL